MGILAWAVLGLIAGALAKLIYPGHQGGGMFATNSYLETRRLLPLILANSIYL